MRFFLKLAAGIGGLFSFALREVDAEDILAKLSASPDRTRDETTVPSAVAAIPLHPSTDGSCGNGITCAGSGMGRCCSVHGYCGDSEAYCGDGCNSLFGSCVVMPNDSNGPVTNAINATRSLAPDIPIGRMTVNITKTLEVTSTKWFTATSILSTTETTALETFTSTVFSTQVVTTTASDSTTNLINQTYTVFATETHNITSTVFQTIPIAQWPNNTDSDMPIPRPPSATITDVDGQMAVPTAKRNDSQIPAANSTVCRASDEIRVTRTVNLTTVILSTFTIYETLPVSAPCTASVADSPFNSSLSLQPRPTVLPSPPRVGAMARLPFSSSNSRVPSSALPPASSKVHGSA